MASRQAAVFNIKLTGRKPDELLGDDFCISIWKRRGYYSSNLLWPIDDGGWYKWEGRTLKHVWAYVICGWLWNIWNLFSIMQCDIIICEAEESLRRSNNLPIYINYVIQATCVPKLLNILNREGNCPCSSFDDISVDMTMPGACRQVELVCPIYSTTIDGGDVQFAILTRQTFPASPWRYAPDLTIIQYSTHLPHVSSGVCDGKGVCPFSPFQQLWHTAWPSCGRQHFCGRATALPARRSQPLTFPSTALQCVCICCFIPNLCGGVPSPTLHCVSVWWLFFMCTCQWVC